MKALELCDKVIVLSEEVGMYCYDCGCKDYEIEAPKLAHALKAAIDFISAITKDCDYYNGYQIDAGETLVEIDRICNE